MTDVPERVLVITAHPDDVDFGAAGTIALWRAAGTKVSYVVVTDGDAGGYDPTVPRSEVAAIRRLEQRQAAAEVDVEDVEFLGYPDGALVADLDLRRDLARAIRRLRPERVLCQSPERDYRRLPASHPDHIAAGSAALSAVYPDARNRFFFPELIAEGLEPHSACEVWLMAHPETSVYVDITETLEKKLRAIGAHVSQLPDPSGTFERVRGWTKAAAMAGGLGEERHAEAFFVASFF